jgi:hypothetical protein
MALREATPGTSNGFNLDQKEMTRERQPPTFSAQFPLQFPLGEPPKIGIVLA